MLWKQVKWSADGSLLLAAADDNHVQVFSIGVHSADDNIQEVRSRIVLPVDSTAHDLAWFPYHASFLACVRGHPLQLWDASGWQRAAYVALQGDDRLVSMRACAFSATAQQVYSVGNQSLYLFNFERAGKPISSQALQMGHLSCLSVRPDDTGLMAVGSFDGQLGLLQAGQPIATLPVYHRGGITQIELRGWRLYSSARGDSTIGVWDLRHLSHPVEVWDRGPVASQQRMYWDLNADGSSLYAGNSLGEVRSFGGAMRGDWLFDGPIAAVACSPHALAVAIGDRSSLHPRLTLISMR